MANKIPDHIWDHVVQSLDVIKEQSELQDRVLDPLELIPESPVTAPLGWVIGQYLKQLKEISKQNYPVLISPASPICKNLLNGLT